MNFYLKNTKKDIRMTKEDEEHFRSTNNCWFCETEILDTKGRDHCHLTGDYRGVADEKCNIIVKQKDSNFIPILFHNFSNYDCHLFFKKLIDKKPIDLDNGMNKRYADTNYLKTVNYDNSSIVRNNVNTNFNNNNFTGLDSIYVNRDPTYKLELSTKH